MQVDLGAGQKIVECMGKDRGVHATGGKGQHAEHEPVEQHRQEFPEIHMGGGEEDRGAPHSGCRPLVGVQGREDVAVEQQLFTQGREECSYGQDDGDLAGVLNQMKA